MASVIQVANRALTKLGSARITSIDDDVKAARSIKSCFDDVRDDELRSHRWQFAMKRTSLAALSTAPEFGYEYQYQVPTDFLKIDMVDDRFPSAVMDNYIGAEYLDWALEGNLILTDIGAPLKLRYVAQVTDPNGWDPNFREALACRLAAELAEDLTQSNEKRRLAWEEYKRAITQAIRSNAIEKLPVQPPDDAWVIGRL
jgi:hypothetical protein